MEQTIIKQKLCPFITAKIEKYLTRVVGGSGVARGGGEGVQVGTRAPTHYL